VQDMKQNTVSFWVRLCTSYVNVELRKEFFLLLVSLINIIYNIILILLIFNAVIIKYIYLYVFHMQKNTDRNNILNMYIGTVKIYT
jgi:hypothetical protein